MTDNNHPITPPPELVGEWLCSEDYLSDASTFSSITITSSRLQSVASQAARWGADQELEVCCRYIGKWFAKPELRVAELRAARRPKPPSLAEQALAHTNTILNDPSRVLLTEVRETLELNRCALERLQELEGAQ